MRNYAVLSIIIAVILLVTPLITVNGNKKSDGLNKETRQTEQYKNQDEPKADDVRVLRTQSGKTETMSETQYLIGAVSAEMMPTYHEEALKAQAVACYTYMLYSKESGQALSDDSRTHQGYLSDEECKEKWGKKYETYHKKIVKACEEVTGKYISFNGKPIMAAFHAICSGNTESAADVWGKDVPYLKSVVSDGDRLSPDYSSELSLTAEQFKECCKTLNGCTLPDDITKYIGKIENTGAGGVKSIEIGGKKYTGEEARRAFGLRSNHFKVEYKDEKFVFTVVGYGHGVGLSQYGADYMARQGSNYEEILKHYYTGTEITV